ncbi:hypothetical protein P691DRAFT_787654 [Macrolepiota fuliginosa MF-IS2]|uniref:Uncharacterized protein n=1 Tax=Macrolepiota fuliginosa MF-IS2 TaxID=1400762 RepID=A0A9P5X3E4_9AGAR|nr:hypothetical protein P691DRAFT_787654 [Macrolepiota fuliginosa MF-IS2]
MPTDLEIMPTAPIDNWGGGSPTESTTNAMQTSIGEWMSLKDIDSIIDNDLYSKEEKLKIIFESYELLQYTEELTTDILVFDDNSSQYGVSFATYSYVAVQNVLKLAGSEGVHFKMEEDEVSIIKSQASHPSNAEITQGVTDIFLPRQEDEDDEEYT